MSKHHLPVVYLAGPAVFRPNAIEYGDILKKQCARHKLIGRFPLDCEISARGLKEPAREIYLANVGLLDASDAVIADISPFRGPHMDPGTAWEIGYAVAKKLPVFAWSDVPLLLAARTKHKSIKSEGIILDDKDWVIENFGLIENLMIVQSVFVSADADAAIEACAQHFLKNENRHQGHNRA